MDETRRRVLGMGTVAAIGVLSVQQGVTAQPASGPAPGPKMPPGALRLVTFATGSGAPRPGVISPSGQVVELTAPASMLDLIRGGAPMLADARQHSQAPAGGGLDLAGVRLLPPIPVLSRNIYAVGWNYLEHFEEGDSRYGKRPLPKHPVFFTKGTHTLNGPFEPIPFDPAVSEQIDWEGELAVVIGRGGRNIAEADAMGHVFGYTVINDTTARDMQADHGGQWFKGKSLDGHGPMGPWLIPASDLDYDNLDLTTRVNGVVKQSINTRQMYFKIPRIIAELSLGLTLEPGDIIATGTPSGIGASRNPPEYLKPGDVMETEIAQIGTLRNVITLV